MNIFTWEERAALDRYELWRDTPPEEAEEEAEFVEPDRDEEFDCYAYR